MFFNRITNWEKKTLNQLYECAAIHAVCNWFDWMAEREKRVDTSFLDSICTMYCYQHWSDSFGDSCARCLQFCLPIHRYFFLLFIRRFIDYNCLLEVFVHLFTQAKNFVHRKFVWKINDDRELNKHWWVCVLTYLWHLFGESMYLNHRLNDGRKSMPGQILWWKWWHDRTER